MKSFEELRLDVNHAKRRLMELQESILLSQSLTTLLTEAVEALQGAEEGLEQWAAAATLYLMLTKGR